MDLTETRSIALARSRTVVMGVLNATPDSFYAPSRVRSDGDLQSIVANMISDGADILDIGGESSRPGAEPVTDAEEIDRIAPWFETAAGMGATLSIDTYRAATAKAAIDLGAHHGEPTSRLFVETGIWPESSPMHSANAS